MKKFTAFLLCLVLIVSLCACGKNTVKVEETPSPEIADEAEESAAPENTAEVDESSETEENLAGMANPSTEYESLEEINEVVGGNLAGPGVMGTTDKAYTVIDCGSYKIAEYRFEVNGTEYTLRCAKVPQDISGVYMSDGGTAFGGKAAEQQEIGDNIIIYSPDNDAESDIIVNENGMQFNSDSEYKCARWFIDDMQYVLTVNDKGGMEQETFEGIADEIMQTNMT